MNSVGGKAQEPYQWLPASLSTAHISTTSKLRQWPVPSREATAVLRFKSGTPRIVYQAIVLRIIEAANGGERDAHKLCKHALETLKDSKARRRGSRRTWGDRVFNPSNFSGPLRRPTIESRERAAPALGKFARERHHCRPRRSGDFERRVMIGQTQSSVPCSAIHEEHGTVVAWRRGLLRSPVA